MTVSTPTRNAERSLLVTMTGEPYQPVRLYYSVPNKVAVTKVLLALHCTVADGTGGWLWHYEAEASALRFSRRREDLPDEVHPIILGRFHFPSKDSVVLAVRSGERAIEAAKFFCPLFGPSVVLRRLRTINRFFEASEAGVGLDRLDTSLDKNVVRVNWQDTEDAIEAALAGARTPEEKRRAFFAYGNELRKKDVPLVEDFPLDPEAETSEFRDLAATLRLRITRAFHHWRGETHLTLADVIDQVAKRAFDTGPRDETHPTLASLIQTVAERGLAQGRMG